MYHLCVCVRAISLSLCCITATIVTTHWVVALNRLLGQWTRCPAVLHYHTTCLWFIFSLSAWCSSSPASSSCTGELQPRVLTPPVFMTNCVQLVCFYPPACPSRSVRVFGSINLKDCWPSRFSAPGILKWARKRQFDSSVRTSAHNSK